jgi:hypothetical protein
MSTKAAESKAGVINQEILDLEQMLAKVMTLDKKTGKIEIEEGTYVKFLPEGITEEQVKSVQAYNSLMATAAGLAVGNMAIPTMTKDAELNKVTLTLPTVGKDYIGISFDRSRQVPARDDNNQPCGTRTKFGNLSVEHAMYSTKSRGQLLAVKTLLGEQAMASFGS